MLVKEATTAKLRFRMSELSFLPQVKKQNKEVKPGDLASFSVAKIVTSYKIYLVY